MQIKSIVYEKLTSHQRTIATIEAMARNDKDEVQRLAKTCPRRRYSQTDAAYSDRMGSLLDLAAIMELEATKAMAWMLLSVMKVTDGHRVDDLHQPAEYAQQMSNYLGTWKALLNELGLDSQTVADAIGTKPVYSHLPDGFLPTPDPKFIAACLPHLRAMVGAIWGGVGKNYS